MADVLTGIPKEASKGAGGISVAYIAFLSDVTGATASEGVASFASDAGVWKKFVFGKQAGSNFTYTPVGDIPSGTIFYDDLATFIFRKNQTSKRNEMKVLGRNELVVIINDNNAPQTTTGDCSVGDLYIIGLAVCGSEGGAEISGGGGVTGAQLGEANQLTIAIAMREAFPPLSITEADYLLVVAGSAVT